MDSTSNIAEEDLEKIVAFVDREAALDAPLSADDEAEVRIWIEQDPKVQELVDELRAVNVGLDSLFEDVSSVDVPEGLEELIRSHGKGEVAALVPREPMATQPPADRGMTNYGPLAAAASVALVLSVGAHAYFLTTFSDERETLRTSLNEVSTTGDEQARLLAEAENEVARLAATAEQAAGRNHEIANKLAASEEINQLLSVENARLQGQLSGLESNAQELAASIDKQTVDLAKSEAVRDRLQADLARAERAYAASARETEDEREALRREIDQLAAEIAERNEEIAGLAGDLASRDEVAAAVRDQLAEAQASRTALAQQLAASRAEIDRLAVDRYQLAAGIEEDRQRIVELEDDLNGSIGDLVASRAVNEKLAEETNRLNHVAGYYRLYAGTAREVEVTAEEEEEGEALSNWLSLMIGGSFPVPDLTEAGLSFVGGRVFAVSGEPVGQIAYHDRQGRLVGFCFMPREDGEEQKPTASRNGDLNLVSWNKDGMDYVVIGWADAAEIGEVGRQLYRGYGDRI